MTTNDLKERLMQKVIEKAENIIDNQAKTLISLIEYEIAIVNTELAMSSKDHGYNFNFISESYADGIVLHPAKTDGGSVTLTLSIPSHVFKNASDEEIAFFKQFVLSNAMMKFRRGN